MDKWKELFMKNMVSTETLKKLAEAGKIKADVIEAWSAERLEKFGF